MECFELNYSGSRLRSVSGCGGYGDEFAGSDNLQNLLSICGPISFS